MSRYSVLGVLVLFAAVTCGDDMCPAPDPGSPVCVAPADWFRFPPKESDYHEPTKGVECEFYQFAWQTFLFLIQPDEHEELPKFLKFHTPDQLFGGKSSPRFAARFGAGKQPSYRLLLSPRLEEKKDAEPLSSVLQAVTHSTLVDQTGRAVYYSQHMNKRFEDFLLKYIKDPKTGAIDPSRVQNIAAYQGFPEGCIELKTSWKIAVAGDEQKFFTIEADLSPFKAVPNGQGGTDLVIDTDPAHLRVEKVALVGMHVVATTVNHAEFIWATFEHRDNAPGAEFGMANNAPVDNNKPYTFYKQGTPLQNCNLGNRGKLKFKNGNDQGLKDQILEIQNGPEKVSQVCGEFKYGAAPDGPNAVAQPDPDVCSLNKSVLSQMPDRFGVWKNYALRGAVWIDDPNQFAPGKNFFTMDEDSNMNSQTGIMPPPMNGEPRPYGEGTVLRGEHRLSNPTMETFSQGRTTNFKTQSQSNCFACHTTEAASPDPNPNNLTLDAKLVNVSHIVVNALMYSKSAPPAGPSN